MLITTAIFTAVKIYKVGAAAKFVKNVLLDEPVHPLTAKNYAEKSVDWAKDKINNCGDDDGSFFDFLDLPF